MSKKKPTAAPKPAPSESLADMEAAVEAELAADGEKELETQIRAAAVRAREKDANFPLPPEWDPDYQPEFIRPSMISIPRGLKKPMNTKMARYWSGKDRQFFDSAIARGFRPVQRESDAPEVYARPNIDGSGQGTTVERHDLILMEAPQHLMDKVHRLQERELRDQARGIQSAYEDSQSKAGGVPVHSLFEPGMAHGSTPTDE